MIAKDFEQLRDMIFEDCKKLTKTKGEDYSKGNTDVLAHFRESGFDIDLDSKRVCWIFMNKHYQAITNYVRTNGESESENIHERIKDMINYLIFLGAIISSEGKTTKRT